ncbi:MAG: ATP-NAD kinase family protein [Aestuariibacter sp.]
MSVEQAIKPRSLFRLGLVINPFAGIGGALALKGSDGKDIREKALAMGAKKMANARTETALQELIPHQSSVHIVTAAGEMGADLVSRMGFSFDIVYDAGTADTEPEDTIAAAKRILSQDVDMLLFAGGDGTARNICEAVETSVPMLGVPAGCKIHSGVYAITPRAAGRVAAMLIQGELVTVQDADVMDIDEQAFRDGVVKARPYGAMRVPAELTYVQSVKNGGRESEELVLADIAAHVIELMDDELFIMGSGSTVAFIMDELGLDNTLLGVDVIQREELLHTDVTAPQLLKVIEGKPCKLVITLIGGQGHIFGRGNQQLSPEVIRAVGRDNIIIVATKTKLQALAGRPLIADTGDETLNRELAGLMSIVTGYHDEVLYPVANPE